MRSTTLWALAQADRKPVAHLLGAADAAGYDLALHEEWLKARQHMARSRLPASGEHYDVVIVGGGAGGIASAASILRRDRSLSIAIIEPRANHYYQPGWTMVGAGVFESESTRHRMTYVIPTGATWIKETGSATV